VTKLDDIQNIPSFNLKRQNEELREQLLDALAGVIDSGMFILGDNVKALESEIANYCDAEFGIGVASGSDALYLALLACGVGPSDEVITTPFTFFATAGSIERAGATPVFVDIDPATLNIDPEKIEEKITPQTKAIMPVHLYGCPADMDPIIETANNHGLKVVEDAAQALGAKYKDEKIGGIGDVGCISFFPTKNLGAFGDAGMVVTNDPEIAEKVSMLRVHGAEKKYFHSALGCNSRLDELQAAVLRIKLNYLDNWTESRRAIASTYNNHFSELKNKQNIILKLPEEPDYAYHVYHQYTIQTEKRDDLQMFLKERGIGSVIYYPQPMHLQKVFTPLGYNQGDFPNTEHATNQVLSLPMFPELIDEEIRQVVSIISEFLG